MDLWTAKGAKTLQDERRAIALWSKHYPSYEIVPTPRDVPAPVDAIVTHLGEISAVAEFKCRYDMDLAVLQGPRENRWLISQHKIDDLLKASFLLGVPAVGFLYLAPDDCLLTVVLSDPRGRPIVDIETKRRQTSATVNGGISDKPCAFVDMTSARVIRNTEWSF